MSTEPATLPRQGWATMIDADRSAARYFEDNWVRIIGNQPPAVAGHLAAERRFAARLLRRSGYRSLVEAGCADGTLLMPAAVGLGLAYLGVDLAPGAVAATRRALRDRTPPPAMPADAVCGDIRDLPALLARAEVPLTAPVLVAFPFNVFGNIPAPRQALATAAPPDLTTAAPADLTTATRDKQTATPADLTTATRDKQTAAPSDRQTSATPDLLLLTYDTSERATEVRAEYYARCGFAGQLTSDATGVHFAGGLFTSSVYHRPVLTGWLAERGYDVRVHRYGEVGLAYHARS